MIRHITFFLICTFLHFKKKINIFLNTIKYYFKELYFLNLINNYFFISKKNIFKSKRIKYFFMKIQSFGKIKNIKILKRTTFGREFCKSACLHNVKCNHKSIFKKNL